MGQKLISFLTPIAHFFQKGAGTASVGDVAPFWLVVGAIVIVLIAAIFILDKPKALSLLLVLYIIWFVISLIPGVMKWFSNYVNSHNLYYAQIALGALPIIAYIVHKKKKRR